MEHLAKMKKDFREFFKAKRKEKGFTQKALADLAGCSSAFISQIETGSTWSCDPNILLKLDEHLGLEKNELSRRSGWYNQSDVRALKKGEHVVGISEEQKKYLLNKESVR